MRVNKINLNNPFKLNTIFAKELDLSTDYRSWVTLSGLGDREHGWFALIRTHNE